MTCHTGPCGRALVQLSLSSSSQGEPDQALLPGARSHRLQELWQREELHPLHQNYLSGPKAHGFLVDKYDSEIVRALLLTKVG